jgi:hypothetical protein
LLPSTVAASTSEYLGSPDKSSSHSLYPQYSEEVPNQSSQSSQPHQPKTVTFEFPEMSAYQQQQSIPVFTLDLPNTLQQHLPPSSTNNNGNGFNGFQQSTSTQQQQQYTNASNGNPNPGFQQDTADKPSRNLVELNRKLLRVRARTWKIVFMV